MHVRRLGREHGAEAIIETLRQFKHGDREGDVDLNNQVTCIVSVVSKYANVALHAILEGQLYYVNQDLTQVNLITVKIVRQVATASHFLIELALVVVLRYRV